MPNFSYWETKYFWHPADFLVVGGGITGLTTAIFLHKNHPKARIVVVERGIIPAGASTKNAGFACFGSASEVKSDLNSKSENEVFSLIQDRFEGLHRLRELLSDEAIGYEPCGGYEIFLDQDLPNYRECVELLPYLNDQLRHIRKMSPYQSADKQIESKGFSGVRHMLFNASEGLIDTGLMMKNLTAMARGYGVDILTGLEVIAIHGTAGHLEAETSQGTLRAGKACVATNGFAKKLLPMLEVQPCRAQVLVTNPIEGLKVHGAFHHHEGFDYFRHVHGRILLGGGRHHDLEREETDAFDTTYRIQSYLERLLRDVIAPGKEVEIAQRWSGIMGMGGNKSLIVQEVNPGLYCAVRFGGMGVALGTAAGFRAAEMMTA